MLPVGRLKGMENRFIGWSHGLLSFRTIVCSIKLFMRVWRALVITLSLIPSRRMVCWMQPIYVSCHRCRAVTVSSSGFHHWAKRANWLVLLGEYLYERPTSSRIVWSMSWKLLLQKHLSSHPLHVDRSTGSIRKKIKRWKEAIGATGICIWKGFIFT